MIRKWWQRLMGNATPVVAAPEPDITQLPLLERCRVVYSTLDLTPFMDYQQNDGRRKMFNVVHTNIDSCINDVATQIGHLERNQHVPQPPGYTDINKPVNRFFISKEGHYLNSVYDKLVELRTVTLDLCKAVEATRETDYYSYNQRMLAALLLALYDLGMGLNEISTNIQSRT